jgi:hypothetical protein
MTFHHITATSQSVLMKRVPPKALTSKLLKQSGFFCGAKLWFLSAGSVIALE